MTGPTPFKGRTIQSPPQMRVLHRFVKPGHWAEIRERNVTTFRAIEFILFVDGSLLESQLFHNGREAEYPAALAARVAHFIEDGWTETLADAPPSH
jgi:hypothetical protein